MMKYLAEFVGTFVFLSIILKSGSFGNLQPFVIAVGLLAAILLCGAVSGGHFNPAVSTMVWARDSVAFPTATFGWYVVVQVLGGLAALLVHQMSVKA
jgi:glycerol uptake facilitator-like aquaporin